MRTFIENYLHFMKNCIRPPYKKFKPLKSGFMENSNFDNNRDPCFRIERMLTRLVAEKFTDRVGINWSELVNQHKEFVEHTSTSLSGTFHKILYSSKKHGRSLSLQEVADCAAALVTREKKRVETIYLLS